MNRYTLLLVSLLFCTGCLHIPLKNNYLKQSQTISQIEQQQVLDNIAKFVCNPGSMPHFAVPQSGVTAMNVRADAGNSLNYTRTMFDGWGLTFGGGASADENWTMQPVTDSGRLERLRCAFQMAVNNDGFVSEQPGCVDCLNQMRKMGLLNDTTYDIELQTENDGEKQIQKWVKVAKVNEADTLRELDCNFPRAWYCVGSKHQVPHHACYVSHHCDTYVWVMPTQLDDLTRFTLTILTLATADPAEQDTTLKIERKYGPDGVLHEVIVKSEEDVVQQPFVPANVQALAEKRGGIPEGMLRSMRPSQPRIIRDRPNLLYSIQSQIQAR